MVNNFLLFVRSPILAAGWANGSNNNVSYNKTSDYCHWKGWFSLLPLHIIVYANAILLTVLDSVLLSFQSIDCLACILFALQDRLKYFKKSFFFLPSPCEQCTFFYDNALEHSWILAKLFCWHFNRRNDTSSHVSDSYVKSLKTHEHYSSCCPQSFRIRIRNT